MVNSEFISSCWKAFSKKIGQAHAITTSFPCERNGISSWFYDKPPPSRSLDVFNRKRWTSWRGKALVDHYSKRLFEKGKRLTMNIFRPVWKEPNRYILYGGCTCSYWKGGKLQQQSYHFSASPRYSRKRRDNPKVLELEEPRSWEKVAKRSNKAAEERDRLKLL